MKKIAIIFICFLMLSNFGHSKSDKREIKIAIYDSISPSVSLLERAFRYEWEENGIRYETTAERIDFKDVMNGNLRNYDILIIGASGRQYFHGLIKTWREKVKEFIAEGGGYVGICGGANIASKGYEKPKNFFDFIINLACLKIVDAYINDNQDEEWQYLWKEIGDSRIPLKNEIVSTHPVFDNLSYRYITYGGGPGMYGMEKAKGIAIYADEAMEVAPLHYWIWLGKWIPYKEIKTDIKGQYSIVESEYGKGKIIVFSSHPEIPCGMNGSVYEFFGISIYGVPRYVYSWINGNNTNMSYNWWILRRAVAYTLNLPLPPMEELFIYLRYKSGEVNAYVENAEKVIFYVDGEIYAVENEPPFKISINDGKSHVIRGVAIKGKASVWDEITLIT
ncbi:MAG: hypothetical protein H5T45_03180 [Thermoplasmatales archaeon]|nr:hypothetical protein [Thermoplasmatales archaeon]